MVWYISNEQYNAEENTWKQMFSFGWDWDSSYVTGSFLTQMTE